MKTIKLPGFKSQFLLTNPIIPNGNFTWAEATKEGSRIPESKEVVENIMFMASRLEYARRMLNVPMIVNSWYRDPETNAAVGGVPNSPHLTGMAIDFYCNEIDVNGIYTILHPYWLGGLGSYTATGHTHLDLFAYRRW